MRNLYPEIDSYNQFHLKVSDLHSIYVEESGNPDGIPIIRVNGGPGGKLKPKHRRYYDPDKYRIILFDQRGCGQSKPFGELKENTTWDLVDDMEKIRKHLKIDKWIVYGRSWGSTLGVAYAQQYQQQLKALILGGIYMFREWENSWIYQEGINKFYPDIWEKYLKPVPQSYKDKILDFYIQEIVEKKKPEKEILQSFMYLEANISTMSPDKETIQFPFKITEEMIVMTKIFLHYVKNKGFMKDGELLKAENLKKIKKIPGVIVQSRYDMVCPFKTAWELYKKWESAELQIVYNAGHRSSEEGNIDAMIKWTDKFAQKTD
ncbi:prolyl aminopeptidase [Candidatus Dojkabacteria bacterium]|nr:prolyl aminopeptidase [Candidatus Dojkabacteria bacterium]